MKEYFENILVNHNFKLEMHIGLRKGDEFLPLEYWHEIEGGCLRSLEKREMLGVIDKHLLINFVAIGKAKDHVIRDRFDGVEVLNVVVDDKLVDL